MFGPAFDQRGKQVHLGKSYLLINGICNAFNDSSSQKSDRAADATIQCNIASPNANWEFSGEVFGDGFVGGPGILLNGSDVAENFFPTKEDMQVPILQRSWDTRGQSANVHITPAITSRTGGSLSVWIPRSYLPATGFVTCQVQVSAQYTEYSGPPARAYFGDALVGIGFAAVTNAEPGKPITGWRFTAPTDPKTGQVDQTKQGLIGAGSQGPGPGGLGGFSNSDSGVLKLDLATGKVVRS